MALPDDNDSPSALPRGTRLGEFEIRRVLGIGGFGIVYLAFDHALEREVAIKEYMPGSLAGRSPATLEVAVLSQSNSESFALGLRSFVNEARLLARFDHPSLVKVHRYWEAHHTAYMAMPYYAGQNLQQVRRALREPPGEAWLRSILEPLLGALDRLHREGVFHRDVSPDNVLLEPDGRPVLLDFGAARRVIGDRSVALTAILKPAYAPIEQYGEAGAVKQGPWTDLYALGATLHFLLLGRAPPPATTRTVHDELQPLAQQALPGCSARFLRCVDWMLQPRPADRPQQVADLLEALAGRREPPLPAVQPPPSPPTPAAPQGLATEAPPAPDAATLRLAPTADATAWAPTTALTPAATPAAATGPDAAPGAAPDIGLDGPVPATGNGPMPASPVALAPAPAAPNAVTSPGPASVAATAVPTAAPAAAPGADAAMAPGVPRGAPLGALPGAPPGGARWPLPAAVAAALAVGLGVWWGLREPPAPATAATAATAASAPRSLAAAASAAPPSAPAPAPDAAGNAAAAAQSSSTPSPAPAIAAAATATPSTSASTAPSPTRPGLVAAPNLGAPAPRATSADGAAPRAAAGPAARAAPAVVAPPAPATATGAASTAARTYRWPMLPPPPGASPAAAPGGAAPAPAPAPAASPTSVATPAPAHTAPARPASAVAAQAGTGAEAVPMPRPAAQPTQPTQAAQTATPRPAAPPPAAPPVADPEAEGMVLKARVLSPSERCAGRMLLALWACIERQCSRVPELRTHPECVKARRDAEQRNDPR